MSTVAEQRRWPEREELLEPEEEVEEEETEMAI